MGQLFMGVGGDSVYKGDFQFMGRLFIGADGDNTCPAQKKLAFQKKNLSFAFKKPNN